MNSKPTYPTALRALMIALTVMGLKAIGQTAPIQGDQIKLNREPLLLCEHSIGTPNNEDSMTVPVESPKQTGAASLAEGIDAEGVAVPPVETRSTPAKGLDTLQGQASAKVSAELKKASETYRARHDEAMEREKISYRQQLESLEQRATESEDIYAAAAIRRERESNEPGIAPFQIPKGFTSPTVIELLKLRKNFDKNRVAAITALNVLSSSELERLEKISMESGDPISAAQIRAAREALQQPPLCVVRASYGAGKVIDVTAKLRKAVIFNHLELPAENSLGGNPHPHVSKLARITYRIGEGPERIAAFRQGTMIQLPRPAEIVRSPTRAVAPEDTTLAEPKSVTPPPPPLPVVKKPQSIILTKGWNGRFQGGDMTLRDLATLFHGHGTASDKVDGDPTILVFEKAPFLTPIDEAQKLLKLTGQLASKNKVVCPGLPRESFFYYAFDGNFEEHFNRLYLVTDAADQLVCAQLVDETPRMSSLTAEKSVYHTYNFVNYRTKALNPLIIQHQITNAKESPKLLVVNSVLINPPDNEPSNSTRVQSTSSSYRNQTSGSKGKILERSRWYVPQPIVNLILRCVGQR